MCVTNGFCQLIYSLHAMGTRSKIVQYPKSLNNQKKPSLTCCQSSELAAVCWLFRLPLDCAAWLSCDIDFCDSLEENHISFYWLESYINCIMENMVAASEKPILSTVLFWDGQYYRDPALQSGRKAASFTSTCGRKCSSFVFVILSQLLIISLHKMTRNYITTKWVGFMFMWIAV